LTVYFISGLGADERVFQKLQLPINWNIKHIVWDEISINETLQSYCLKLSKQINVEDDFSLVGVSFGGIVAIELSKIFKPRKTIIISSITSNKQLPTLYKLISFCKLQKLVPTILLNKAYPFTYWFFGVMKTEEKLLLKQIINDTPQRFLKWAINEILSWKNKFIPQNLTQINGDNDKIFPMKSIATTHIVEGGGHFMIYNKADEISKILIDNISNL
jgi:pimeloyl-ACP methyl ester carboxylesterase